MTDSVLDEVREWQSRALERIYPIVIFDALRVKSTTPTAATSKTKPFTWPWSSVATGAARFWILWIAENERANFSLSVMNELRNRGQRDVVFAVVDGLKGLTEAITADVLEATVQICSAHLVRHSLNYCSWKDRRAVAADLRRIYSAPTANIAEAEPVAFEGK